MTPELKELLEDLKEYFERMADADHDESGPVPNEEMRLLVRLREVKGNDLGIDT